MNVLERLLDLLFPPKCPFCARVLDRPGVCAACEKTLPWTEERDSLWELPDGLRCAAPLWYRGGARQGLLRLKFRGAPGAAEPLGAVYGAYGGEGAPLELHYNEDWTLSDTREYAYALQARPVDSGVEGLAKVSVQVLAAGNGTPLFAIEVAWQEVSGRG